MKTTFFFFAFLLALASLASIDARLQLNRGALRRETLTERRLESKSKDKSKKSKSKDKSKKSKSKDKSKKSKSKGKGDKSKKSKSKDKGDKSKKSKSKDKAKGSKKSKSKDKAARASLMTGTARHISNEQLGGVITDSEVRADMAMLYGGP